MKTNEFPAFPDINWYNKNKKRILYIVLIVSFLLGLMSFNAKISEAHDDALYLEGGWRFVHEFPEYFYTQNAPLYPMFLAILIKFFGFKLLFFKFVSFLFFLGSVYFTFLAFEGLLPVIIFLSLIVFQSTNYLILYYSGMTFTESFFLFLQSFMFLMFRKWYNADSGTKVYFKYALLTGLMFFLISTCKSSAITVIPAFLFFIFLEYLKNKNKDFLKKSSVLIFSYAVIKFVYELLVKLIWNAQNQFKLQSKILFQKDPYDASQGQEDLAGFFQRLLDNSELYLSKRFFQIIGWMSEQNSDTNGFLTLLMYFLIIYGLIIVYKKGNKIMFFFSIYIIFQTLLSFIVLQTRWDQARIIMINMPVLIPLILIALSDTLKRFELGQYLFYLVIIFFTTSNLISGVKRAWKNYPIAVKNLKGDRYYGYTPDWINFLKCSEWCADHLPADALVASRKAPMSFVYGKGKKFFPVYSVVKKDTATDQSNPDSALVFFRKNKVTHIMLPSLRIDPNMPGIDVMYPDKNKPDDLTYIFYRQGVINTIHNILYPIYAKYPQKLKLIHKEGDFEECYLFEFQYDK